MDTPPDELTAEPDYLAWANTVQQLGEARLHLTQLIDQMQAEQRICTIDLGIQLGHIYGHLNRVWNGKHVHEGNADALHTDEHSQFPTDIIIT